MHSTSARVDMTLETLSASMAVEVSWFFMEKVLEQPVGAVADLGDAHGVAGRVVGDPVREGGADVGDPQDVDEQLGELVGLGRDLLGAARQGGVAHVLGHERLLVAGRPGTGAGGHDDGVPLAVEHRLEGPDMVADEGGRLREVPGVRVHLAAADLALGEDDLMAEPFQDGDGRLRRLREHRVSDAGREECDAHRWTFRGRH